MFFPLKEDFVFALECLARIPLEGVQLVALFLQLTEIRKLPEPPKFNEHLFLDATFIFFVQDFVYDVFIAYYGELYWFWVLVISACILRRLLEKADGFKLVIFMGLWGTLLAQHVYTLLLFYDDSFIRGFNAVYMLILLLYFVNTYLWFRDNA